MVLRENLIRRVQCSFKKGGGERRFSILTPAGVFSGIVSEKGIEELAFPKSVDRGKLSPLKRQRDSKVLRALSAGLRAYFEGRKVSFGNIPVSFSGYSRFTEKVLRSCRRISYGQRICYEDLARRTGHPGASRAVGTALGKNRVPVLIPCHRVISKNGSLGGYSSGLKWKKTLLALERSLS